MACLLVRGKTMTVDLDGDCLLCAYRKLTTCLLRTTLDPAHFRCVPKDLKGRYRNPSPACPSKICASRT